MKEFLPRPRPLVPSCLIFARSLRDPNGLEERKQIARERAAVPIVVISRYEDIPTTVEAMKAGAVDFLVRPFRDEALWLEIRETFERRRFPMPDPGEERLATLPTMSKAALCDL